MTDKLIQRAVDLISIPSETPFGENINDFLFVGLEELSGYQATHTLIFNEASNINWTDEWDNIGNCSVVAYVYNDESLTIEQSTKKHIINE